MPGNIDIFSKSFIDSLPDDNDGALTKICDRYHNTTVNTPEIKMAENYYEIILRAYAFLKVFIRTKGIDSLPNYEIVYDPITDIRNIQSIFQKIGLEAARRVETRERMSLFNKFSEEYTSMIDDGLKIEIPESKLEEIQKLIDQLRKEIQKSSVLSGGHRERLLRRLEKLQSELHKTVSNLDAFWTFIGDAGTVLGKFGKDVKPIVDRIREIAEIITSCLSASQGLPQGAILSLPEIPTDNDNKKDKKQKK